MAKKLNLKPLLLEKGERFGLYIAAGLSGLLVLLGVWNGITSGSAKANAQKLEDAATKLEQAKVNARPTDRDNPPPLPGEGLLGFHENLVSASDFTSRPLYFSPKVKDMKRQMPNIFSPEDFKVAVVRAKLPSLDFTMEMRGEREVPAHVTVVKKGTDAGMGKEGGTPFGANQFGKGYANMMMAQGLGMGGAGGMKGGSVYISGRAPAPKTLQGGNEVKSIPIAGADTLPAGFVLADKVLPLRMAVIAATFPYKRQVEEFRQKLRLDTHGAVLTERVPGEKGESWNAFQFRGIIVERAVVEMGKPLEWEPINIEDPYKRLLIFTGRHVEKDPEELKPVKDVSLGLVLELPKQYKENQYPDLFGSFTKIKNVLKSLAEDSNKSKQIVTPKLLDDGFNPFDLYGKGVKVEGDSEKPMNPELNTQQQNRYTIAGTGALREVKETPIDHSLLRFIDVTLEPGKVYRYRVRVKMANPNYSPKPQERKDTYPQFAKDKELLSEWVEVPHPVVVPLDSAIYALKHKSSYEASVQMHRWVEDYRPDPRKPDVKPVGEWIVSSEITIRRGEYLRDRNVKKPIPIKNLNALQFELDEKSTLEFGDESILVNFEGGLTRHQRTTSEDIATEILVMTPDGRVYARNSYDDQQDPERVEREQAYKARIDEVKNQKVEGSSGVK